MYFSELARHLRTVMQLPPTSTKPDAVSHAVQLLLVPEHEVQPLSHCGNEVGRG